MKKFTICFYIIILSVFLVKNFFQANFLDNFKSQDSTEVESKKTYDVFIELPESKLYLFENESLIKTYPISGGDPNSPSPTGIWKICDKRKWGFRFGGSWMKLDVPWGKYGIHGTRFPWSIGKNHSHGCIRMYNKDAKELYNTVSIGTTVVISNGVFEPLSKKQRIIKPGDAGSDVLAVQRSLKKHGFYHGALNGKYNDTLKKAVFKFQKAKGYKPHNKIKKYDLRLMGLFHFE